jgi:hypothetical protein
VHCLACGNDTDIFSPPEIVNRHSVWIFEDCKCIGERNSMLGFISFGLLFIPFKNGIILYAHLYVQNKAVPFGLTKKNGHPVFNSSRMPIYGDETEGGYCGLYPMGSFLKRPPWMIGSPL